MQEVVEWARQKETMRVVSDQIGNPTWACMLAEITVEILTRGIDYIRERKRDSTRFTSDIPTPAQHPIFSALDRTRFSSTYTPELPDQKQALFLMMQKQFWRSEN
jgi:dTDP-4-dehydrorhamnose reductase